MQETNTRVPDLITDYEQPYPFIRQVESEHVTIEPPKPEIPTKPVYKKSITAGEAMAKLNNILDAQARLRPFELANDKPRSILRRSEPISGSVRLAQLVSLERELKEALYFRSLESPWSQRINQKGIPEEDFAKISDDFHRRLAQKNPMQVLETARANPIQSTATPSRKIQKSKTRSPWRMPLQTAKTEDSPQNWQPLPDTYSPGDSWTKLQEKMVASNKKTQRLLRIPLKTQPLEKLSSSKIVEKSPPVVRKRWDPATHRQENQLRFKQAYLKSIADFARSQANTCAKFALYPGTGVRFDSDTEDFTDEEGHYRNPTQITTQSMTQQETANLKQQPEGLWSLSRSGYFRMPPLKPMSAAIVENPPPPETAVLAMNRKFNINNALDTTNPGTPQESVMNSEDVPNRFPQPWQFFKFQEFENRWDPTVFKPTGSALMSEASDAVKFLRKNEAKLGDFDDTPCSMDVLPNLGSRVMSDISSEVSFDALEKEIQSSFNSYYDSRKGRLSATRNWLSLARESPRKEANSILSSMYPKSKPSLQKLASNNQPYVDRGLEGALGEVQKAIKTAIPTFKPDASHHTRSQNEVKTDEWMKKFIEEMSQTPSFRGSRTIRSTLQEIRSQPSRKIEPKITGPGPTLVFRPSKLSKPVPNVGDPVVVYVVNGKPQIPDFTVGTHFNSYLAAPKTYDYPPTEPQRLTRCTVCQPYNFGDGHPDPSPNKRKFCRNIPLPGFRDFQIFFKLDKANKRLIVNAFRNASGDECYRNVTHVLTIPNGMNILDLQIYRTDKGTLFFHDSREELALHRWQEWKERQQSLRKSPRPRYALESIFKPRF